MAFETPQQPPAEQELKSPETHALLKRLAEQINNNGWEALTRALEGEKLSDADKILLITDLKNAVQDDPDFSDVDKAKILKILTLPPTTFAAVKQQKAAFEDALQKNDFSAVVAYESFLKPLAADASPADIAAKKAELFTALEQVVDGLPATQEKFVAYQALIGLYTEREVRVAVKEEVLFVDVPAEIKNAIAAASATLLDNKGYGFYMMDKVALLINSHGVAGRDDPELLRFVSDARKEENITVLEKSFAASAKDGQVSPEKVRNLAKRGEIKDAAVLSLCARARNLLAKQGLADAELSKRFGEAQGVKSFTAAPWAVDHSGGGKISNKLTLPNFLLARVLDGAAITFVFNLFTAYRTGNWNNEYLLLAPLAGYAASKAIHNNTVDNALHPDKRFFNLASRLFMTRSGRDDLEFWRNPQEMRLAKMIDWNEVRRGNNKAFDLTNFGEKTASPEQKIAVWQKDSLANFPLLTGVDPADFVALLNSLGGAPEKRYEFLKFIAGEKDIQNSSHLEEVASHAREIAKTR